MTTIKVNLLGFELRSPLVAASGPMTRNFGSIKRLAAAGIGAAITKTILLSPSTNPQPCLHRGKGYFLNTERCSTIPLARWLEEELPRLRTLEIPIIASIGMTPDDAAELAPQVVEAGAQMLELSIFTGYDDPQPMVEAIRRVKAVVDVPVIVKLSSNVHDIVEFGRALKAAGADAVSAIDAVKAGITIDPVTGRPALLQQGFGRVSGEAIKALALYNVAQLAHYVGIPIIGTGGVTTGVDAIEMLSCGAAAVGVCTAFIVDGPEKATRMNEEMREFMHEHGFSSLDEIRGRTISQIDFPETTEERQEYEKRQVQTTDRTAVIDQETCVKCGICRRVCLYSAVDKRDGAFVIDPERCKACGLCVSMCPVGAIDYEEKAR